MRRAPYPGRQPPFRFLATYYVVETVEHLIGGFQDPPKRDVDWEPVSLATLGERKGGSGKEEEERGRGGETYQCGRRHAQLQDDN